MIAPMPLGPYIAKAHIDSLRALSPTKRRVEVRERGARSLRVHLRVSSALGRADDELVVAERRFADADARGRGHIRSYIWAGLASIQYLPYTPAAVRK